MDSRTKIKYALVFKMLLLLTIYADLASAQNKDPEASNTKTRVIITSDGEIDDECSMVRCLLYSNEWDIEGIITTSSQYHWQGHKWAGDDWLNPYLKAYAEVYPNLKKHDKHYPSPEYLRSISFLGNVKSEGEMTLVTPGSQRIVNVLLDTTDNRPIWIQAWGGTNTIARALKTIQEEHPDKMGYVAHKIRFYLIWEQDSTYQSYIRPNWSKFGILTIISDQFWALAYEWEKILPSDKRKYFQQEWMNSNILKDHGSLCALYKAKDNGAFRSEGDSPAFLHNINTGLRNMESPEFGGWGGRFVKVRENTWLDPVPDPKYQHPSGRWFTENGWGRKYMREEYPANQKRMNDYFKALWRWSDAFQNDFAARADWCVTSYKDANHPPLVKLAQSLNLNVQPRAIIKLSAKGTKDPDGDKLKYKWWQYQEAGTYNGVIAITNSMSKNASLKLPSNISKGETIHIICEVTDNGTPKLTRYQRIIITAK